MKPLYDDQLWESVDIPHMSQIIPYHYFDETSVWKDCCYRKHISLRTKEGEERVVRFEGVSVTATVYFNGEQLAVHKGPYTPFEVILPEDEGELVVHVSGEEDPLVPPFGGAIDYLVFSGIYRSVSAFVRPKLHLTQMRVDSRDGILVTVDLQANCDGEAHVSLLDGEKQIAEKQVTLTEGKATVKFDGLSLERWDLKKPRLYQAECTMGASTLRSTFGCRDVRFTYKGFYLNDLKIKLVGLDRHQCYPYVGYAMTEKMQRDDARRLKASALNIVRSSHYPPSPAFLDECDKIGLLVLEEIPGWQHIGRQPEWRERCVQNVKDMVERDINHPSVVLWGVRINESPDDDELYQKTNRAAHDADPSRQTCGIRNFKESHLLEDVYTYNDFSHRGDNEGLSDPKTNAPYLVTEHNGHMYPTKRYDDEDHRTGQFLRHIAVMESSFAKERVCGAIGWCYADYQTHSNFGSGDGICYHGVYDQNREPKFAAYAYICQQDKTPVLVSGSTLNPGDVPETSNLPFVVATNCERVDLYADDTFVKSFFPDRKRYPHVPHPPVFIDDMVGERLKAESEFSPKEQELIDDLIKHQKSRNYPLSWKQNMDIESLWKRHHLDKGDVSVLINRYTELAGQRMTTWTLKGIIKEKVVCSETYGPNQKTLETLEGEERVALPSDGYEVVKLTLRIAKEGMTMPLPYAMVPFQVSVKGPLALLSPSLETSEGGVAGIYLKTTGERGDAKVTVRLPDKSLEKVVHLV